jgi:hypothetical protein
MEERPGNFYTFLKKTFSFYVKATKSDTAPFFKIAPRGAHVFSRAALEGII